MIVRNSSGREFYVRVVFEGERYGLNDCLTHDKADPLIEFYDRAHVGGDFGPRGQFVSRYYASTLAEHEPGVGLALNGGIPVWSVDGVALAPVVATAKSLAVAR
jgi:hypothetical protein